MQTLSEAMRRHALLAGDAIAVSDDAQTMNRRDFAARVLDMAASLQDSPSVIGLFAPNGIAWAVTQLACALAGKLVVPLPTFFSPQQLAHVVQDASVGLVLTTPETMPQAAASGIATELIERRIARSKSFACVDGFGQIIYTSGSTGQPKGVRHESGQIAWSMTALANATQASIADSYLSVLPLPLLLETICAVFIPALLGAKVHYATGLAERVGRGDARGLAAAFDDHRPTSSVVVPQLLRHWTAELSATGRVAPSSLRFVAVGGAPVSTRVADDAWRLGIPAYEGYGLSECCSVVAVARPGERRAGTVGRPLDGLSVKIDNDEIVVDGPTVMDGYLGQTGAARPWRTGDIGSFDADGFLSVRGRKDSMLVTAFGRNVSPEWIETMIVSDARVGICAVVGYGEPSLSALLIPSADGAAWFALAREQDVFDLVADACVEAPDYARPRAVIVVPFDEAARAGLLSPNGRPRRAQISDFVKARSRATDAPVSGTAAHG